jgi:hypothetical protein
MIEDLGVHTLSTAPTIIGITAKEFVWVRTTAHPQGFLPFGSYLLVQTVDRVNGIYTPQLVRLNADLNGVTLDRVTTFKLQPYHGFRRRLLISTPNGGAVTIAVNAQDASDLAVP